MAEDISGKSFLSPHPSLVPSRPTVSNSFVAVGHGGARRRGASRPVPGTARSLLILYFYGYS